jgi:hypothetical protein
MRDENPIGRFESGVSAREIAERASKHYLRPVSGVWSRAAGVALLVVAVSATALVGFIVYAGWVRGPHRILDTVGLIILGTLLVISAFCWLAGTRLALDRPHRSGSMLSSAGWSGVGIGLTAVTSFAALGIYRSRAPAWEEYRMLLGMAGLIVGCWVLAYRARTRAR